MKKFLGTIVFVFVLVLGFVFSARAEIFNADRWTLVEEFKSRTVGVSIHFIPAPDTLLEDKWFERGKDQNGLVNLNDLDGILPGNYTLRLEAHGDTNGVLFEWENPITIYAGQITTLEPPVFKLVAEYNYQFQMESGLPDGSYPIQVITADENPTVLANMWGYSEKGKLVFWANINLDVRRVRFLIEVEDEKYVSSSYYVSPWITEAITISPESFDQVQQPGGTGGVEFIGPPIFEGDYDLGVWDYYFPSDSFVDVGTVNFIFTKFLLYSRGDDFIINEVLFEFVGTAPFDAVGSLALYDESSGVFLAEFSFVDSEGKITFNGDFLNLAGGACKVIRLVGDVQSWAQPGQTLQFFLRKVTATDQVTGEKLELEIPNAQPPIITVRVDMG